MINDNSFDRVDKIYYLKLISSVSFYIFTRKF